MTFERIRDPSRPGLLMLRGGEPVAAVFWSHDFAERPLTGWFVAPLDDDGEPEHELAQRLSVSEEVEQLAADTQLARGDWLARAETVELLTATAALDAAERLLDEGTR